MSYYEDHVIIEARIDGQQVGVKVPLRPNDNPIFHADTVDRAIQEASVRIRDALEAIFGKSPSNPTEENQ